jgi:hypothetical protein
MIVSSLSFYPHFLSYTTEIIPDRKMIYRYMADSNVDWGQNAYYVEDYIQRHGDEHIALRPEGPVAGTVIVNVNDLVGVNVSPKRYAWLRENFLPEEHIAYSWLVFRVTEADLERLGLKRLESERFFDNPCRRPYRCELPSALPVRHSGLDPQIILDPPSTSLRTVSLSNRGSPLRCGRDDEQRSYGFDKPGRSDGLRRC